MRILEKIRNYPKAYKMFLDFLMNDTDIKNVSTYLAIKDELAYGYIDQFVNSLGITIVITNGSISLIMNDSERAFHFGAVLEHNGAKLIYYSERKAVNTTYPVRLYRAIDSLFELLEENLIY